MNVELSKNKTSLMKNSALSMNLRSYTMGIALVIIWVLFLILTKGTFLSPRNLGMLMRQTSGVAILALGMTLVIVAGHIDLSVGSVLGFLGAIAAIQQVWYKMDTTTTVVLTILLGMAIGLWQGFWVAYAKVPAFIVTLGGLMIFRGTLLGVTKAVSIAPLSDSFRAIGQAYIPSFTGWILAVISIVSAASIIIFKRKSRIDFGFNASSIPVTLLKIIGIAILIVTFTIVMNQYQGIPVPVLILACLAIIVTFIATKTKFGRSVYAIGGNIEAARLSGINIRRVTLFIFVIMGILSAISGIILTARLNAATSNAGNMAELDVIASCIIGGTSLIGGVGSIPGAIIGALVMSSLDNGMSLMNTENFWQYIVKGLILMIAVFIDISSKKKA